MIQKDINFVSMCRSVQQVLTTHKALWQPRQVFAQQVEQLERLFSELSQAMEHSELRSEGVTERKAEVELEAVQLAVNLSKRSRMYALDQSDMALHDQLHISKSGLLRLPDYLTLSRLRDVRTRMHAHVPALDYYGVTAADLEVLDQMIDSFEQLISMPRTTVLTRKTINKDEIPGLLADIRYVLYKTDNLINLFPDSALEREYKHARMTIDAGSRHTPTTGPAE